MRRPGTGPALRAPAYRAAVARGFTLVEVLVALAIVAVTLGAGLRAAGALTDSAQRLADVTAAQWCADNALTNLRLARQFPGADSEFDCAQLGREFHGRLLSLPTPNPNFRRVEAVIVDEQAYVLVRLVTVVGRY